MAIDTLMPLRAVLFDLDGTVLDTAPDMVCALNALRCEEKLGPLPFVTARACVSHGAARLVAAGFPNAAPEELGALRERFLDIYRTGLSLQTRLFPGMDRVLAGMTDQGLISGIVTNKPAWLTEPLLAQLGLRTHFACVVSGDTVSERKPHPLPLLHAADLAGVAPGECVFVGDAERDVQAAHAAGMPALVAVYGYLQAGEDWQAWGADAGLKQPLDLLDWLERSGRT